MRKLMFIMVLSGSALLAQNRPLPNGVYAIDGNPKPGAVVVRQYDGKNIRIDTTNFAPLILKGKPAVIRDAGGSGLSVQLAPEAAMKLEDLTRSRINQQIAVVVGDRIVSAPTVRSAITGGLARITPCDDPACENLLRQLSK